MSTDLTDTRSAIPPLTTDLPSMNPFERLRALLRDIKPGLPPITMTLGEPSHAVPAMVGDILSEHTAAFGKYPPIAGTQDFRAAVADWLERRYRLDGLVDPDKGILPLNGSREGAVSCRHRRQKLARQDGR